MQELGLRRGGYRPVSQSAALVLMGLTLLVGASSVAHQEGKAIGFWGDSVASVVQLLTRPHGLSGRSPLLVIAVVIVVTFVASVQRRPLMNLLHQFLEGARRRNEDVRAWFASLSKARQAAAALAFAVDDADLIGKGSLGTKVYIVRYRGVPAALKRLPLPTLSAFVEREAAVHEDMEKEHGSKDQLVQSKATYHYIDSCNFVLELGDMTVGQLIQQQQQQQQPSTTNSILKKRDDVRNGLRKFILDAPHEVVYPLLKRIMYGTLQALLQLHRLGYVHCDIAPSNFLIFVKDPLKTELANLALLSTSEDVENRVNELALNLDNTQITVKLTDFGLAVKAATNQSRDELGHKWKVAVQKKIGESPSSSTSGHATGQLSPSQDVPSREPLVTGEPLMAVGRSVDVDAQFKLVSRWMAPEVMITLQSQNPATLESVTLESDCYSVGCLLFDIFTWGRDPCSTEGTHHFNPWTKTLDAMIQMNRHQPSSSVESSRDASAASSTPSSSSDTKASSLNIQSSSLAPQNAFRWDFQHFRWPNQDIYLAHHLILGLRHPNPEQRLSAAAALKHPFFWDDAKIVRFYEDLVRGGMFLKNEITEGFEPAPYTLLNLFHDTRDWTVSCCEAIEVAKNANGGRGYDGSTLRTAIELIRNLFQHAQQNRNAADREWGDVKKLASYFRNRLPKLLLATYLSAAAYLTKKGRDRPSAEFQATYYAHLTEDQLHWYVHLITSRNVYVAENRGFTIRTTI